MAKATLQKAPVTSISKLLLNISSHKNGLLIYTAHKTLIPENTGDSLPK